MAQLDEKFSSLNAIANYLKLQVSDTQMRKNPWMLYHAAISAGLAGDREFSRRCFNELIDQKPHADWMKDIQIEATSLAKLLMQSKEFHSAIKKKVSATRAALKLPALTS